MRNIKGKKELKKEKCEVEKGKKKERKKKSVK